MKREFRVLVFLSALLLLAGTAAAVPPVPAPADSSAGDADRLTIELLYDVGAKTSYETDISGYGKISFEAKREIAVARASYGDFFLSGGWTRDASMRHEEETYYYPMPAERSAVYGYPFYEEPEDPEGDGFIATAGIRSRVWGRERFSLYAYGQLDIWQESYDATATYSDYPVYAAAEDDSPVIYPPPEPVPEPITVTETYKIALRGTELAAGLIGAFTGKRYTVYAGLELPAYSDIEADVDVTSSDGSSYSDKSDVDRADMLSFVLGMKASFGRGFLVVETLTLGETNLRVGAGVDF